LFRLMKAKQKANSWCFNSFNYSGNYTCHMRVSLKLHFVRLNKQHWAKQLYLYNELNQLILKCMLQVLNKCHTELITGVMKELPLVRCKYIQQHFQ
jgi:hypothetical protein